MTPLQTLTALAGLLLGLTLCVLTAEGWPEAAWVLDVVIPRLLAGRR